MIFMRKTNKNNFLKILILAGLTFNFANLNAFPVKNSIEESQGVFKSFIESFKADPVGFIVGATVITAIVAGSVALVISEANKNQEKKDVYDKKLKETCIVCEKSNKECACNLLEKIKHVFFNYRLIETRYYLDGRYQERYCNWLTKKIKSVLLKINDINMKFNYKDGNETILHIACDYGHEPIIKWLVEDMFVNINAVNSNGVSARKVLKNAKAFYVSKIDTINETSTSRFYFLSKIDECVLDKKLELQNELLSCVKSVKTLLKESKSQEALKLVGPDVRSKLGHIRELIESRKTPGFAKQLVMSDLVFIHQNFKEFIGDKLLVGFYKHIAFNYTFLNDSRFASALAFAGSAEGKDIYGRSVAQAREVYKEENKDIRCERVEDFIEADYYSCNRLCS